MGSHTMVYAKASEVKSARTVEGKLDALADTVYELARFVDDLRDQLRRIEDQR